MIPKLREQNPNPKAELPEAWQGAPKQTLYPRVRVVFLVSETLHLWGMVCISVQCLSNPFYVCTIIMRQF